MLRGYCSSFATRHSKNNIIVLNKYSFFQHSFRTEFYNLRINDSVYFFLLRIRGIKNRKIRFCLIGKYSGLDAAVLRKRTMIIDMIAGDIQKHRNKRPEFFYPLSWKLLISATIKSSFCEPSTYSIKGVPMFPPTNVFFPERFKISPNRVVVVVLPLVPVTAITGTFKNR